MTSRTTVLRAALAVLVALAVMAVVEEARSTDEAVVSTNTTPSAQAAPELPDGTYLVLPVLRVGGVSPAARGAARTAAYEETNQLADEARRAGYKDAEVVRLPGVRSGCRALEKRPDGSEAIGCGDVGTNVGYLVVLKGPYTDAPTRPSEYLPWALATQRREQADAAIRRLSAPPQIAFFEFSLPPDGD